MTRPALSIAAARPAVLPLARWIGIAVAAGMLLAFLGPFGSYLNVGVMRRLGYWIGAMLLGLGLYGSAYGLVRIRVAPSSRGWWPALIVAALLASIPEALATRAAAFRLWPELSRIYLPLPLWFAQTATIGLVAMAGIGVIMNRVASKAGDIPALPPATKPLAGDVLALQMEDHYVRVHRPAGSELVLMPLGRAIEAMQVDGLRTHRSWWVAAHSVVAVEGSARAMRVRLSNGVIAPVARSAVIHLKSAGWLVDTDIRAGSGVSA